MMLQRPLDQAPIRLQRSFEGHSGETDRVKNPDLLGMPGSARRTLATMPTSEKCQKLNTTTSNSSVQDH
jgi:hypothetical protein